MKTTMKFLIENANKSLLVLVLLSMPFNWSYAQSRLLTFAELTADRTNNWTNDANFTTTIDANDNSHNTPRSFSWFIGPGSTNADLLMYLTKIPASGNELHLFGKTVIQNPTWNASYDNLTSWADSETSYIQSNGDEQGLKISSNTGNKVYIGDSNDQVFFPGTNIGIGINSPQFKVHANGGFVSDVNGVQVMMGPGKNSTGWIGTLSNSGLFIGTNNTGSNMYLDTSDNVYIGGVQPNDIKTSMRSSYDLFVHNGILSEDYGIGPKTTWADYVFNDTYELKTLKEIDEFISVNKHLPNMPSQKSVSENGYNLHEMNVTLLEKIEELMLYTINQQKELDKLKEDYTALKKSIHNLQIKPN
ncbi:hypothetical protein SGQ83_05150 [Flavobacterium sp. Fl-318]|uniref:Peptidase S74 domain-containing protein n=1 Tax=Flavobacterium cupriresistens TaxID=2893885 RepID=A0ABU4R811_9FLAO|nr:MULTISPECIES: hypothetical protein [unclassified Flavobacterium]MDX6188727.1 hypothetical protein [Flavobacterium sp. Fl-318]UFH44486.1 hypothetical protein LNP23_09750 [Flavobacterium sp. F-323]